MDRKTKMLKMNKTIFLESSCESLLSNLSVINSSYTSGLEAESYAVEEL